MKCFACIVKKTNNGFLFLFYLNPKVEKYKSGVMKDPNKKISCLHYLEYSYWNDISNIQTMSIMHPEYVTES